MSLELKYRGWDMNKKGEKMTTDHDELSEGDETDTGERNLRRDSHLHMPDTFSMATKN